VRHIYTVSIDADLEKELDEYQKSKGYQTRSEGAIQLLKKGLQYDSKIKEPKKKIKNSLLLSYLFSGLALIPATYALTVGFGISNIGSFSTTSDPGLYVFTHFLGPIGAILLIVFTINSYHSNGVAKTNAVSRVWFSASRDRIIFPKSFSEVHKKYKSPYKAIRGYMIVMLVINLLFGFLFGPKTGALILLTRAGIGIIFTHVYANISLTLYTRTQKVSGRWYMEC